MSDVLIVDDDVEAREAMRRYLEKAGHEVECVSNGRQAIVALGKRTPDVVVLDHMMPEMNGIGFLEVVRCYLRWSDLPVILVTAYPDGPHIKRAKELGVVKIFPKAYYDLSELANYVEAVVRPLIDPANPQPPTPGDVP